MSQSVENTTAVTKVSGSSLGHSLLFDQNLGTCKLRTDRKKIEDCDITLACASAIKLNFIFEHKLRKHVDFLEAFHIDNYKFCY